MPETAHMTERTFNRVSPLQDVAVQGRFGADKGAVGVTFTVRHPMSIVTVIARAGQGDATAAALKGYLTVKTDAAVFDQITGGLGGNKVTLTGSMDTLNLTASATVVDTVNVAIAATSVITSTPGATSGSASATAAGPASPRPDRDPQRRCPRRHFAGRQRS